MEKDETFLGVSSCIVAACTVARVASSEWREIALRHAYKGFAQKNQGERLVLGGPVLRMQVAGRLFYGKRGARLAMRPLRRRRAGVICGRTSLQCCAMRPAAGDVSLAPFAAARFSGRRLRRLVGFLFRSRLSSAKKGRDRCGRALLEKQRPVVHEAVSAKVGLDVWHLWDRHRRG